MDNFSNYLYCIIFLLFHTIFTTLCISHLHTPLLLTTHYMHCLAHTTLLPFFTFQQTSTMFFLLLTISHDIHDARIILCITLSTPPSSNTAPRARGTIERKLESPVIFGHKDGIVCVALSVYVQANKVCSYHTLLCQNDNGAFLSSENAGNVFFHNSAL